jgi:hypothetical protein
MDALPLVTAAALMTAASRVVPAVTRWLAGGPRLTTIKLRSGEALTIDLDKNLPPVEASALVEKAIQAAKLRNTAGLREAIAESHLASEQTRRHVSPL